MACCKKARALRAKKLKEAKKVRALLSKSTDWESMRRKLVGTWLKQPEWACEQLKIYLERFSTPDSSKLKIVQNYLNSGGFKSGKIQHSCIQRLKSQISMELKKREAGTK